MSEWTKETQKKETLEKLVRKDVKGNPRAGDITVCSNLLGELRNRIKLHLDHTQKAQKYEKDILEYLATLETRGVKFPAPQPNPNPSVPMGPGQSGTASFNPYDKKRGERP